MPHITMMLQPEESEQRRVRLAVEIVKDANRRLELPRRVGFGSCLIITAQRKE
jgi:hypothetical protein